MKKKRGKRVEKIREKVSLDIVESAGAIIVWTFFVFLLFERGFQEDYSPVQLGVISFLFSGTMALANGIIPSRIRGRNEKGYMAAALVIEVFACILLFLTYNFYVLLLIIVLEAICYSIITESRKALMERKKYRYNNEFIFRLFRMAGPFLGGGIVWFFSGAAEILYIVLVGMVGLILVLSVNNDMDNSGAAEEIPEPVYITSEKYSSKLYIYLFLFLIALMTLCIQVVDAQLVTVFHHVAKVNAVIIGGCIGCSGIGVFLISGFLEKHIVKDEYFFVSFLLMGIVLTVAGIYVSSPDKVKFIPLILLFFCGGIFWQVVMTFLENVIKSVRDTEQKKHYFGAVGIISVLTYSTGALGSGFLVGLFTIERVYIGLGTILFTVSVCIFIYIKLKRGGKNGKAASGQKSNKNI